MQHLGDRSLQPLMGVGDHQLDPAQAAACELAQELRPEGLGLGSPDPPCRESHATVAVDANGNNDGDSDNAPGLADFHVGGIEPM